MLQWVRRGNTQPGDTAPIHSHDCLKGKCLIFKDLYKEFGEWNVVVGMCLPEPEGLLFGISCRKVVVGIFYIRMRKEILDLFLRLA